VGNCSHISGNRNFRDGKPSGGGNGSHLSFHTMKSRQVKGFGKRGAKPEKIDGCQGQIDEGPENKYLETSCSKGLRVHDVDPRDSKIFSNKKSSMFQTSDFLQKNFKQIEGQKDIKTLQNFIEKKFSSSEKAKFLPIGSPEKPVKFGDGLSSRSHKKSSKKIELQRHLVSPFDGLTSGSPPNPRHSPPPFQPPHQMNSPRHSRTRIDFEALIASVQQEDNSFSQPTNLSEPSTPQDLYYHSLNQANPNHHLNLKKNPLANYLTNVPKSSSNASKSN
jgi:hypothetical protein